ncbi:hypothetical protein EI94DRAFT_1698201 [Lactarius quietus]|nr:hypothetical protein EI94DRAFT_1698201 [Lactarius quietus]
MRENTTVVLSQHNCHGQQGHIDEHGTLQYQVIEVCPIGAIARLFFAVFHIMKQLLPNFKPNFTMNGYEKYGLCKWYDYHVFADHLKQVSIMHKENGVKITKSTHVGCCYSAMNLFAYGATVGGVKALRGWNERDPPKDVLSYVFPWVEAELKALKGWVAQSCLNQDIALQQFLELLQWLCVMLVQDCAMLQIFHFKPFTFSSFIALSADAVALMRQKLNHSKLWDELQKLQRQNTCLKLLLCASKGFKHKTSVMLPPPTVPSPAALPPPRVGVKPLAPVVTDLPTPILPSSSLPAIIINFSGLPISSAPVSQLTASLAPPALPPATSSDDDRKLAQWKALTDKLDDVHMQKHEGLYEADYVPLYCFQPVTKICWNLALAQRFLQEKYKGTTTPRKMKPYWFHKRDCDRVSDGTSEVKAE